MMNDMELQILVEKLSIKYFKKPFIHKAYFNSKLRTTGGRYHLDTHDLDFNPKVFANFDKSVAEGIIKHELCHYHLHLEGKGYRHIDTDFKKLMRKVNGLRFTPSLELKQEKIIRWEYECQGCETIIYRKRRFNLKRFICSKCNNYFKINGQVTLDTKGF